MPVPYLKLAQKADPGCRLVEAVELTGGMSAQMTKLVVEGSDGRARHWIVRMPGHEAFKFHPQAVEIEYKTLKALRSLDLPVPAPLWLEPGGELLGRPCILIEYIEGQPEYAPADPAGYARQLAVQLADIHRANQAGLDLSFLPNHDGGMGEFNRQPAADEYSVFPVVPIRSALKHAWPIPRRNPTCLLHGDYWPGNVLWRDGCLVGVIDWEDAAQGDPLFDLAVSRLDLLWIVGNEAMEAFTCRYLELNPIEPSSLPLWDLVAALRLARLAGPDLQAWTAFFHPFGRMDITPEKILASYRSFTKHALENLAD